MGRQDSGTLSTHIHTTAKMNAIGKGQFTEMPRAHDPGQAASSSRSYRTSGLGYLSLVVLLHLLAIGGLLLSFHSHPSLVGLGWLAYSFGLRHAFDIDHIAAIDNTVRKLTRDRTNPNGTGFFFSLGHSTVVFVLAILASVVAGWVHHTLPHLSSFGDILGACVAGGFLLLIGIVNIPSLFELMKTVRSRYGKQNNEANFRQGHKTGSTPDLNSTLDLADQKLIFAQADDLPYPFWSSNLGDLYRSPHANDIFDNRGLFFRFIGKRLGFVQKSWHIYPVGVLFGLGFDTATEVSLLVMSSTLSATVQNMKFSLTTLAYVMTLPLLFTAGMSLMDTLDGLFMSKTYSWALRNTRVQLSYNTFLTTVTVLTALIIGLLEIGHAVSKTARFQGLVWDWLDALNFGQLGFILTGIFVISAMIVYVYLRRSHSEFREYA